MSTSQLQMRHEFNHRQEFIFLREVPDNSAIEEEPLAAAAISEVLLKIPQPTESYGPYRKAAFGYSRTSVVGVYEHGTTVIVPGSFSFRPSNTAGVQDSNVQDDGLGDVLKLLETCC